MFVPHDQLTPGWWYLKVDYEPYYEICKIQRFAIGPDEGKLGVWTIDKEGNNWPEDFAHDQFICPVLTPPIELKGKSP